LKVVLYALAVVGTRCGSGNLSVLECICLMTGLCVEGGRG